MPLINRVTWNHSSGTQIWRTTQIPDVLRPVNREGSYQEETKCIPTTSENSDPLSNTGPDLGGGDVVPGFLGSGPPPPPPAPKMCPRLFLFLYLLCFLFLVCLLFLTTIIMNKGNRGGFLK